MDNYLVNIIDVINEIDGSKDQIFIYQERELKVSSAGFKSMVNAEMTYFNLARQPVVPSNAGFQKAVAGPVVHYRIRSMY
jgi:hypothetical protein